jgi:lipoyl synthase
VGWRGPAAVAAGAGCRPEPLLEWHEVMKQIPLVPVGAPNPTTPQVDSRPTWQRLLPEGVERRPPWLTVRAPVGQGVTQLTSLMREKQLVTVCEEARCPNVGECWNSGTATFMILGDTCTRACAFCAVKSGRRGGDVDAGEPRRVGEAVARMGLRHAVVTSVDRDDLADGGASIFAATIREIRRQSPGTTVEVLTPDFQGDLDAVGTVLAERPEIFNHNMETVARLYPRVRPKSGYRRSLAVLAAAKEMAPESKTKSGLMVGLGEELEEVHRLLADLREHRVEIVTIGQYLRPTLKHHPLVRFWHPDEFAALRAHGLALGFDHVESGPLVRSSYHAAGQVLAAAAV